MSAPVPTETSPQNRITERRIRWPATYATPSRISARRWLSSVRGGGRSGRRTRTSAEPETAKETASTAIVGPGPMTAARTPAMPGPTMKPMLKTASKIEVARPTWARPTSPGTAAV